MGITYYGFAFFVFSLLCLLALLCKHLFIHNKGNERLLDEKEKKLLALYNTMEKMMDEFNKTALAAEEEMNHHIKEIRKVKAGIRQAPLPPAIHTAPPAAARFTPSPPAPEQNPPPAAPAKEQTAALAKEQMAAAAKEQMAAAASAPISADFSPLSLPEVTVKERPAERPARILALYKQGLDRIRIAKQLSVTLSEVDLVLGLAAQRE